MVAIPINEKTLEHLIESVIIEQKPRPYLGMSSLGGPCARALWYGLHWVSVKPIPARVSRIFERGDWEEHRIVRDLKAAGVECFRRDAEGNKIEITGAINEEQEELIGFAGHAKGHPDGRCVGLPEAPVAEHLLEFKSANDKNFQKFVKLGVKSANPTYYGQTQRYMKKMKLKRTLFVVTNKNDESRYYERIILDDDYAASLEEKEQHIIMSDSPLDKIGGPTWWECKFCDHKPVCHHGEVPLRNCRTCDHSDMENDGKWTCGANGGKELSINEQRDGCNFHRIGWGL